MSNRLPLSGELSHSLSAFGMVLMNCHRVIAGMPITALFVLFDLVVHNPSHPEIWSNLALLDVAGGHFSRIQYASGGALPGSLITEFAYIAREYVNSVHHQGSVVSQIGGDTQTSLNQTAQLSSPKGFDTLPSEPLAMSLDAMGDIPGPLPVSELPLPGPKYTLIIFSTRLHQLLTAQKSHLFRQIH